MLSLSCGSGVFIKHTRYMKTFAKNILKILTDILFPLRPTELLVDAMAFDTCKRLLRPQTHAIRDTEVISLLPYRVPEIQALCIEAKFHKSEKAYELFGKVLSMYIRYEFIEKSLKEIPRKVVLVPIPLGAKRRAERGYNQVEEIAKRAIEILHANAQNLEMNFESKNKQPLSRTGTNVDSTESTVTLDAHLLVRTKETKPQMTLGRAERMKNMTGVFEANAQLFSDTLYIVIDDVVTTGSTLAAARAALLQTGAQRIFLLALAQ